MIQEHCVARVTEVAAHTKFAERPLRVKGRRGRRADGTADLPSASEIADAFRHLRFVP
jgi:hypothetical protein